MPDLSQLNPFQSLGIESIGLALLVLFLSVLIIGLIGVAIFMFIRRRQLKYTIPLYRMMGSRPYKVGTYKARDFKIGMAGDKLWYVPKAKKYIPVGTLQTAPNEYPHFEREDGEWINFAMGDIDSDMKKAGVKYVHNDMRSQRIAISNLLEQRFKGKQSFWDKYGNTVMHVIYLLVICICMVVIFYQWSDIVDKTGNLFDKVVAYDEKKCPTGDVGVVPAFVLVLFSFGKNKLKGLKNGLGNFL